MPKTHDPYPYSSQITAKTIKDWQHINFKLIRASTWPDEVWSTLITDDGPKYSLKYRLWSDDCFCHPEALGNDVTFEDKEKMGEKLIKPYLKWVEEEKQKKAKAENKKQAREHQRKLKQFLES